MRHPNRAWHTLLLGALCGVLAPAQGSDRLASHVVGVYKEYAWTVVFAADAGTPLAWARKIRPPSIWRWNRR